MPTRRRLGLTETFARFHLDAIAPLASFALLDANHDSLLGRREVDSAASPRESATHKGHSQQKKKTLAARPQPLLRPPALPPPSLPASSGLAALPPLAAATTTLPRSPEPRAPPTSSPGSSSSPSTRCGLFLPFLFFNLPNLKKSTRSPHEAHSLSLPPLILSLSSSTRSRPLRRSSPSSPTCPSSPRPPTSPWPARASPRTARPRSTSRSSKRKWCFVVSSFF